MSPACLGEVVASTVVAGRIAARPDFDVRYHATKLAVHATTLARGLPGACVQGQHALVTPSPALSMWAGVNYPEIIVSAWACAPLSQSRVLLRPAVVSATWLVSMAWMQLLWPAVPQLAEWLGSAGPPAAPVCSACSAYVAFVSPIWTELKTLWKVAKGMVAVPFAPSTTDLSVGA